MGNFRFKRRGAISPRIRALLDFLTAQDEDTQARLDFVEIWTDVPKDDEEEVETNE